MLSNAAHHISRRSDGTRKDPHEMHPILRPISPISVPTTRRRALGAVAAAGLMLSMSACGAIAEKITEEGAERIIEAETGENVELDINGDGGISVQSGEGGFSLNEDGEFVLTDADGSVFSGSAGEDGQVTVESEDGESFYRVVTEIPAEWPNGVPRPDGLIIDTGSFVKAEGETLMTLLGSPNGSAIDFTNAYGATLGAAGFTETGRFDSETDGGSAAQRTYESASWALNISGYVDDSGNVVNLSLVSKT
ncbi:hypothetical protein [Ilumatobacter sp.]|uniref:hypothetical protein n=1 Tax=Ilumatobacter sp. TaxID=1967498 RepID=UPI0037538ED0